MSTALAAGDILRILIVTQDAEQIGLMTFHYRIATVGVTPATDQDAANVTDTAIAASVKALLFNGATYVGTGAQIVSRSPIPLMQSSTGGAGAGTAGATGLPRQTAGLISWKTNFGERKYRGRTYIAFPATADDTGLGVPTAGYVTRADSLATNLFTNTIIAAAGRSATMFAVVYHRETITSTDIVVGFAPTKWATQRRRGSFGRGNTSPI